jgi:two-component system, LytTR family, sensor kinase
MVRPAIARLWARLTPEERQAYRLQFGVVCVMIALLNLGYYREHVMLAIALQNHTLPAIRAWDGLAWFVWLAAAPAMMYLVHRYPLNRENLGRNLWRHAAGNAGIYLAVTNGRYLLRMISDAWLDHGVHHLADWGTYSTTLALRLPLDFLTYGGFLAGSFAIDYYFQDRRRTRDLQELQLRAALLQSELSQAQLTALRGQVQPHFLFNAFNAVATLVRQGRNQVAVDMIAQLSSLLRMTMETIEEPELPLVREIAFVRSYLEIERIRFGEKLTVAAEVDPAALACLVPNLLLQPVVENAVKHGIAPRISPGRVELRALRRGGRLELEVSDDGPGIPESARANGIGLGNVRRRLSRIYGGDYRLEVGARPGGGTRVRFDLPWREAPGSAGAA